MREPGTDLLVITGASRGIGLATAELFGAQGWAVLNLSRSACPAAGVECWSIDFAQPDALAPVAARLAARVSGARRTVLVHNAALLEHDDVIGLGGRRLAEILQINVIAPQELNHLVLPHAPAGSAVLYVGSTLSEKAVAGAYSYVVSKHAMVGMMRATCQDLAGSGRHTACICPGFTDTEMLRSHVGGDAAVLGAIAAGSAFGRLVDPREIAELLWFAATHPVVNGAVIHASLGQIER